MASVSPAVTRTATTSPASLHMTNRWSPRLTSWTSPSLSLNASRTKDEIAEIMLPTTSRSLSVIRVRDMCLTRRPLEPITKTSSIMGSGGATGAASAGAGRARVESGGHDAVIVAEDVRHVRLGPPGRRPGELVVRVVAEGRHTGRVLVRRRARAEGPVVPCLPGHRIPSLVLPPGLAEGD